jgi:hypothetical protein
MSFLKCPKNEAILEYVSIAKELPSLSRWSMATHFAVCADCRTRSEQLLKKWESFFQPEPDLTPSLLRVYSRLGKDETLVLKGWKLNDSRILRGRWQWPLRTSHARHFVMGGGAVALAAVLTMVIWMPTEKSSRVEMQNASAKMSPSFLNNSTPFAQIRLQEKNRVQVHYVQPELLHTIEFETTNQR